MSNTKFFTNKDGNTLIKKFAGVFEHKKDLCYFDVLVGYFRASGYFKIRPFLGALSTIRILVGIDIDALTLEAQNLGTLFANANPEELEKEWQNLFLQDIKQATYSKEVEDGLSQFITDLQDGKLQIKVHPSKNIHAKVYILRPEGFNEHNSGCVISGSSNLTNAGLGTTKTANYEFNVLLNEYAEVLFATEEFEILWQEGVEISAEFVNKAVKQSHLQEITPYELYLKTLIEYFGNEIEFDPNSIDDLPANFKRLEYQMDAVNQAYQILQKHNGCFLADVVGLGKTIVATLVIRQFFYKNGYPDYRSKILLVIPRTLKTNWQETLYQFKMKDVVTIITNGSLHKVENLKDYDMVVVDEAHKFRNNASQAYNYLQVICKELTSKQQLKKVMLISATPLNNRAKDIFNQILLFQDGNDSTLGIPLSSFFNKMEVQQKAIKVTSDPKEALLKTKKLYEIIRQTVIEPLTVRRTRTDLLENQRYKQDLQTQGIIFPKVNKPQPIYYQLPPKLEQLFDKSIKIIHNKKQLQSGLCYFRYQALFYLKEEKRSQYIGVQNLTAQLIAIMKTLLLKRMDSSFTAFKKTLQRFLDSSTSMMQMLKNNKIYLAPKVKIAEYLADDREDELLTLLSYRSLTDPSILICTRDDFEPEFISGMARDHAIFKKLVAAWAVVDDDPKLDVLLEKMPTLLAKQHNPNQKIIIFTESRDTMALLQENLVREYASLGVSSDNIKNNTQKIRSNFDANISLDKQSSSLKILITTDVLSEGINLHRSNIVINYDTPWNAVRLMQRIGRLNRIGCTADQIHIYNFYPTTKVDDQIELEKKAKIKLQAFHSALGEDSQIYSTEEEVATFGIFDDNIQAEKSESLPYLEAIRKYKKDNLEAYLRLKNMPPKMRNAVTNPENSTNTLVFMRTEDKHTATFSMLNAKQEVTNYSFTQAIKLLQADPSIQAVPLPQNHHQQVRSAIEIFAENIKKALVAQHSEAKLVLAPRDKSAIVFINGLLSLQKLTAQQRNILTNAQHIIRLKKYQKLAPSLATLYKNRKKIKTLVLLTKALALLDLYNIPADIINTQTANQAPHKGAIKSLQPNIIIAQSYV